jgi:hypothetical protein
MAVDVGDPFIFFVPDVAPKSLWAALRTAPNTWTNEEVDSRTVVDYLLRSISAALVDGFPAVAYRIDSTSKLHFAQHNGSAWDVYDFEAGGISASMAVDGAGHPHIAHFNVGLRLWSRSSPGPTWSGQDVRAPTFFFGSCSLAFVGGNPAIAYEDVVSFAPASSDFGYTEFNGSTWDDTIVDSMNSFAVVSLQLADAGGLPAFAYELNTASTSSSVIKYAEFNGISWSTELVTGSASAAAGMFPSLVRVCNQSVVGYCNHTTTTGDKCVVTIRDGAWSESVAYDASANIATTALNELVELPIFAFLTGSSSNQFLMYAESSAA